MSALAFIQLIAIHFGNRKDDEVISIGHWRDPGLVHPQIPEFCADIRVTIGELRKMANP